MNNLDNKIDNLVETMNPEHEKDDTKFDMKEGETSSKGNKRNETIIQNAVVAQHGEFRDPAADKFDVTRAEAIHNQADISKTKK